MCYFPSWRECKDGKILFLKDKDIKGRLMSFDESIGHTAIEKVYPGSIGRDRNGFRDCPAVIWKAVYAGECQEMMAASYKLDLRDCDIKRVVFPKHIYGDLDLGGCVLKGVVLPERIEGNLLLRGCHIEGVKLPRKIDGNLFLYGINTSKIVLPIVKGRIYT